ncbi:MAG TPA: acetylornithine transaminase [Desulforhopalus sp.]|nr:acetylornithine transaminase [Desulforhopalus sp.]
MDGNRTWRERGEAVFIGTYSRYPLAMVKGAGCRLYDADGKEYLDFLSGIAVTALGHCHPAVTEAIRRQAGEYLHVSNLFHMAPQIELAELLTGHSFAEKVFLCNSGAEANEAAIKLARIHAGPGRYRIISLAGSFHGRTLATVAATGQLKFHQGFEPLPEGFVHAPFGDLDALAAMIDGTTCAILCEPLQGEGGVRPLAADYLRGIRELCDRHDLLLIFDEIQTGIGRTGSLFAYQQLGIVPDIVSTAKALGNGLPIGAILTTNAIAAAFTPGTHASTFGGNPVAAAAAVATLEVILAAGFLDTVIARGAYLRNALTGLQQRFPQWIDTVRGMGLMVGAVLTSQATAQGPEIVQRMLERGCIINFAGNVALRFVPPLIVTEAEIDQLIAILGEVLAEMS